MTGHEGVVYFFPDTNVLVQCQTLDELDWGGLGLGSKIVLLLSKPVVGELDRQKSGSGRLAKRARRANGYLRDLLEVDAIDIAVKKKGISLSLEAVDHLLPDSSLVGQLDYALPDDRLVGTVYHYVKMHPDRRVFLLSHDTGPLRTAKRLKLSRIAVPDSWLLPPEADDAQKQVKLLEAKLKEYELSLPKVEVRFCEGSWLYSREIYKPLTSLQVDDLMERLKISCPVATDFISHDQQSSAVRMIMRQSGRAYRPASDIQIQEYTNDLYPAWLDQCRDLLQNIHISLNVGVPPILVAFELDNVGFSYASDVLVKVEFRRRALEFFSAQCQSEKEIQSLIDVSLPKCPEPPKGKWESPYDRALSFSNQVRLNDYMGLAHDFSDFPAIKAVESIDKFYWRDGAPSESVSSAELTRASWRHREGAVEINLKLDVASSDKLVVDVLQVTVHAAELKEPVSFTQTVSIETREIDVWDYAVKLIGL